MSSYAEFLREASLLSASKEHPSSPQSYPVAVPHSRGRGQWAQWMREIVIPQDVLDKLVKRCEVRGSSAIASSIAKGQRSVGPRPAPATTKEQAVVKVGGAKQLPLRGVRDSGSTPVEVPVPRSSGRARALRLRKEGQGMQEGRRPGQQSTLPVTSDLASQQLFTPEQSWTDGKLQAGTQIEPCASANVPPESGKWWEESKQMSPNEEAEGKIIDAKEEDEGGEEEEEMVVCTKEETEKSEEETEEEVVVVKTKCGCNLSEHCGDAWTESHCNNVHVSGGTIDLEFPAWPMDDNSVVFCNIPTDTTEEELMEVVSAFGDVTHCTVSRLLNEAGLHTAYIRMKNRGNCEWVISCFNNVPYDGSSVPMACYYAV